VFLQPFIKELAGNLDRKDVVFQLNGLNGEKPCLEALVMDIILYDFQAIFPYLNATSFHALSLVPLKFTKEFLTCLLTN
jgi:hypothetical protein